MNRRIHKLAIFLLLVNVELPTLCYEHGSLLSDILHYSLNSEEFTATLSDELRYAQKYIEIEKFKRDNSFEMITDVDESILKGKCVKFSL